MLEEQIKTSNEENIVRNIDIAKQYSKIIHVLVISSKILLIISGLLSFISKSLKSGLFHLHQDHLTS